jgi:hypothetical protein
LGKEYDLEARQVLETPILYDAKDLCTHAICVGMTGSGKTGLCLALLEEAAIDQIPAICIDPKGDLGNLLLTFPDLKAEDFAPWIDPAEATRKGVTPEELAAQTADTWRKGLESWQQPPERIRRFRESVDIAIYTPGSSAGLPLSVLKSFAAPPASTLDSADAFRERLSTAAAGLLSLLGIEADPLQSREQILLMNILDDAWRGGRSVDLPALIRGIREPPFDKVGVIDLESFFPAKERFELAMRLNNLMASPGFAAWMEGAPLDVQRLLYTPQGKPRLTILSIAHLSDAERMFFVTLVLNEVIAWMRAQSGTSSLRAILYMDEVFGYFPPTANPPSKQPMLTLLKQARAFGLGVVLATQNPVDLDYKGLSNAGTWLLGRLQTERDKLRVLDGLEGASTAAGAAFDRASMERTLSGLGSRVFLMNNVHDDRPVVFQSRWALSFLRGPLSRDQIAALMAGRKQAVSDSKLPHEASAIKPGGGERPVLEPGISELFTQPAAGATVVYQPQLMGEARVHFADAKSGIDEWQTCVLRVPLAESLPDSPWEEAEIEQDLPPNLANEPARAATFAPLPPELTRAKTLATLSMRLKDHLYRTHRLTIYKAPAFKKTSQVGEAEGDFRARLAHELKEHRDGAVEKLRQKYATKLASLQEQIRKAEQRVAKEKEQATHSSLATMVTLGTSLLAALTGRKMLSSTNATRVGTSIKSATRAMKERQDIGHSQDTALAYRERLAGLEQQFETEAEALGEEYEAQTIKIDTVELKPKKADISVSRVAILWATGGP